MSSPNLGVPDYKFNRPPPPETSPFESIPQPPGTTPHLIDETSPTKPYYIYIYIIYIYIYYITCCLIWTQTARPLGHGYSIYQYYIISFRKSFVLTYYYIYIYYILYRNNQDINIQNQSNHFPVKTPPNTNKRSSPGKQLPETPPPNPPKIQPLIADSHTPPKHPKIPIKHPN
jgi:hypothetical protein